MGHSGKPRLRSAPKPPCEQCFALGDGGLFCGVGGNDWPLKDLNCRGLGIVCGNRVSASLVAGLPKASHFGVASPPLPFTGSRPVLNPQCCGCQGQWRLPQSSPHREGCHFRTAVVPHITQKPRRIIWAIWQPSPKQTDHRDFDPIFPCSTSSELPLKTFSSESPSCKSWGSTWRR